MLTPTTVVQSKTSICQIGFSGYLPKYLMYSSESQLDMPKQLMGTPFLDSFRPQIIIVVHSGNSIYLTDI